MPNHDSAAKRRPLGERTTSSPSNTAVSEQITSIFNVLKCLQSAQQECQICVREMVHLRKRKSYCFTAARAGIGHRESNRFDASTIVMRLEG